MKVLQTLQKNFVSIGFDPKRKPFNRTFMKVITLTISTMILLWIFLLHEADSNQQYMESVYCIVDCGAVFLSVSSTIFITKKIFSLSDHYEGIVNES